VGIPTRMIISHKYVCRPAPLYKLQYWRGSGPGKGKCTPAEYQKVGHVDKVVIDDIVKWIEKVKK